jgi:hypothetical protein
MDTGQALTRFFKRDSTQANNLTLLESQERNFWLWLASWSAWLQSPADLCDCDCHAADPAGVPATAARAPSTCCRRSSVASTRSRSTTSRATNVERNTGQTYLLADSAMSLQAAAREKRATIPDRVERRCSRSSTATKVTPASSTRRSSTAT